MDKIWPNDVAIEVLGVTGSWQSGKTLFIATIDPPRTRIYDFEKSAGTYDKSLGFERVDLPDVLQKKYPKGYSARQAFEYWLNDIRSIEAGKYSVIACDPISDIEEGLVEWVKSRHSDFGFQSAENFQKTGGIFWSKVRAEWKQVLADLAARCQTFAFTSHLRTVWKGGKPTSREEPKGKSTLMELASLYLWLSRESGGKTSEKPTGKVLKSRLAITRFDEKTGEVTVHPLLPPNLPVATPQAIREYINKPPDYNKLKASEKVTEPQLTEEERLEMEAQIASDKRAAEESALQRLERQVELKKQHEAAQASKPQSPDQSGAIKAQQTTKAAADADAHVHNEPSNGQLSADVVAKLIEVKEAVGFPMDRFEAAVAKRTGGSVNPMDLSQEQFDELYGQLSGVLEKRKAESPF